MPAPSPAPARRSARALLTALVACGVLVGGSLAGTAPAFGATSAPNATATVTPEGGATVAAPGAADPEGTAPEPAPPVVMGDFPLDSYTARAATEIPAELAEALATDLGETPESYLANADAAANAVAVVNALSASGIEVLGSRLDGTELVVNVADEAAAAAVEAVNATPELGEPAPAPAESVDGSAFEFFADLVGGQGYYFALTNEGYYACSTAFNGADRVSGQRQFVTAGHCQIDGDGGQLGTLLQDRPGDTDPGNGGVLGQRVPGSFALGGELDTGLVATNGAWNPKPTVGSWGSESNNAPVTAGSQQTVSDYGDAIVGQELCKSGATTGWSCGTVEVVDEPLEIGAGGPVVNVDVVSGMCSDHGDSGGAVVSGGYAMGLLSAGTANSCSSSGFTAVFPMIAGSDANGAFGSITSSELNWELAVAVATPVLSQPGNGGTLQWGLPLTGTLQGGSPRHTVTVTVDGSRSYSAPVAQNGSWSLLATDLSNGSHSYSVKATFGSGAAVSTSSSSSGRFTVTGHPDVARIAGADRYDGAVKIAQATYPDTADVVYIATGANYPDALSAGPAAVKEGGPLLLVTRDEVPAVVAAEIVSLKPSRIVVVGGPNSVSNAVAGALGDLVPDAEVQRLAGVDRYAASRNVVSTVFGSGAPHSYAATGTNFPDALSAGGAAGSALEPVVLVNGSQPTADAATLDLFRTLGAESITLVGGPNSVSAGVQSSLGTVPATVDRVAADNRFLTSIALNRSAFTASSTVYLATGLNFPDALAGGVLAGTAKAPLYVVPTDCVPRGVLLDIQSLGATSVVLLGGPNSLAPAVQSLTACAT